MALVKAAMSSQLQNKNTANILIFATYQSDLISDITFICPPA